MIQIKSPREINLMKEAGRIVALCHKTIDQMVKPGVTTSQINKLVEDIIMQNDATPSFKGYNGFEYAICASPNEQIVHGFPNKTKLKDGDIISIDIGVNYKGYHGDSAWTYPVGKISVENAHLLKETENSLWFGLKQIKAGIHLSDVSHAIENYAHINNLTVVQEFAGHGVGKNLHELPEILNYGSPGHGPILKAGMTLAIEPMLNVGTKEIKIFPDGWKTQTKDKKASAHFEHTILVTEEGYEILTKI